MKTLTAPSRNTVSTPTCPSRLYALQLRLRPLKNGTLMPFSGELVHGAFLRWLRASAPDVAGWLHEGNKRRLFTCSSLGFPRIGERRLEIERRNIHLPLDPRETYPVRLTLLLGELFPLFHEALARFDVARQGAGTPPFLQIGKQLFLLEEVMITNDDPTGWTGFTSLSSQVEQARQVKCKREEILTLDFVSLTAFSRAEGKAGYGSHAFMLPLPLFVFQNLARRWQDMAPPELAGVVQADRLEHYLQEEGVIIVDYDLKAHHVHFTTHRQRGFLGSCTYLLRGHDEPTSEDAPLTLRQQIHLLVRLAFYTGVGYKTTMGLGQARLRT